MDYYLEDLEVIESWGVLKKLDYFLQEPRIYFLNRNDISRIYRERLEYLQWINMPLFDYGEVPDGIKLDGDTPSDRYSTHWIYKKLAKIPLWKWIRYEKAYSVKAG
jgi:hypothetical protein